MPRTKIALYREDDGTVPLLAWLDSIPDKARDKCVVRIERLREQGHELRRPEADFLRDGIYELCVALQGINYQLPHVVFFPPAGSCCPVSRTRQRTRSSAEGD
jgi:hypothetical protein